jgi:hypothetical protein
VLWVAQGGIRGVQFMPRLFDPLWFSLIGSSVTVLVGWLSSLTHAQQQVPA